MVQQEFLQLLRRLDSGVKTDHTFWKREAVLRLLLLCRSALRFEADYRAMQAVDCEEVPEAYAMGGMTYIPPELRWKSLRDAAPENKKALMWHMLGVLDESTPALRWVLEHSAWLDEITPQQLDDLVQGLDGILFQARHAPPPELEALFGTLLDHYPQRIAARDRRFEIRPQVASLLAQLLAPCGPRIYDPCCGLGNLLLGFVDRPQREDPIRLYGHEGDRDLWRLAQARLYLRGVAAELGEDPVNALDPGAPQRTGMDAAVVNPPGNTPSWHNPDLIVESDPRWLYGVPPKEGGLLWLQHTLSCLGRGGVMAILLKSVTLSSANRQERQIRLGLLESGLLEAVILLPGRLFYNTKASMSLWILRKDRRREEQTHVLMVDADDQDAAADSLWPDSQARERLCQVYRTFRQGKRGGQPGFYETVPVEEICGRAGDLDPRGYLRYQTEPLPTLEELEQEERELMEEVDGLLTLSRQILWRLTKGRYAEL